MAHVHWSTDDTKHFYDQPLQKLRNLRAPRPEAADSIGTQESAVGANVVGVTALKATEPVLNCCACTCILVLHMLREPYVTMRIAKQQSFQAFVSSSCEAA